MKDNNLKLIALIGLLMVTFSACKTRKLVVVPPPVELGTVDTKKVEALKLLKEQNANYITLSMKGKAQLTVNGSENNVSVNVRIQRDKKIWMSVTAIAGIEIARVLITPDSLLVINRLQGVSLQKPFKYIHTYANREVSFKLLQDLLSGNAPEDFFNKQADLVFNNGVWQLKGSKNDMGFELLFNTLLKTAETSMSYVRNSQLLKVNYGNYQKVNEHLFPSSMQINSLSGVKKIDITFDFSKIESNVMLDFPFTVPKRFEVLH